MKQRNHPRLGGEDAPFSLRKGQDTKDEQGFPGKGGRANLHLGSPTRVPPWGGTT